MRRQTRMRSRPKRWENHSDSKLVFHTIFRTMNGRFFYDFCDYSILAFPRNRATPVLGKSAMRQRGHRDRIDREYPLWKEYRNWYYCVNLWRGQGTSRVRTNLSAQGYRGYYNPKGTPGSPTDSHDLPDCLTLHDTDTPSTGNLS